MTDVANELRLLTRELKFVNENLKSINVSLNRISGEGEGSIKKLNSAADFVSESIPHFMGEPMKFPHSPGL